MLWSLRLGASQRPQEQEQEDPGRCHRGPSRSPPQEPTELLPPVRPGWSEQLRGKRGGDSPPQLCTATAQGWGRKDSPHTVPTPSQAWAFKGSLVERTFPLGASYVWAITP